MASFALYQFYFNNFSLKHFLSKVLLLTSPVLGVIPPVVQVDFGSTSNHQLQLPCIKHGDEPRVNHLEDSSIST